MGKGQRGQRVGLLVGFLQVQRASSNIRATGCYSRSEGDGVLPLAGSSCGGVWKLLKHVHVASEMLGKRKV